MNTSTEYLIVSGESTAEAECHPLAIESSQYHLGLGKVWYIGGPEAIPLRAGYERLWRQVGHAIFSMPLAEKEKAAREYAEVVVSSVRAASIITPPER